MAKIILNGEISANNNLISNVTDPVANQDAATKHYVDTQISSSMGNYLPLAGGTMTNKAKIQYANASSGFVGVTYDNTTDTLTIGTLA